jgi:protein-S-isoprenylcysteine O-methyltransferase Ste14
MVDQAKPLSEPTGPFQMLVDRLSNFAGTAMELAMLQGELALEDARRAKKQAIYAGFMIVIAGALMISALPILGAAFVEILRLFTNWPVWASAITVAVTFLVIAMALFWLAWVKLRNATGSFETSRREATTNLMWFRDSISSGRNGHY